MQINIPDELVNRLVTATDSEHEARAALTRQKDQAQSGDPLDAGYHDRLATVELASRTRDDKFKVLNDIKAVVYRAATGKAVPEGA